MRPLGVGASRESWAASALMPISITFMASAHILPMGGGPGISPTYCRRGRRKPLCGLKVLVCLGLFSFGATASRGCFSPGNEVLFPLIQWGIADVEILVVDDHALIREALRGVLKELKE